AFNDPGDDLSISPRPAALVLFNPVIDNSKQGYGYGRLGERYRDFSPLHNMRPEAPPTIFFLGTQDKIIPVETARRYKEAMEASGNRCELILYENQEHGFFNHKNPEFYRNTVYETDRFLRSLKLLRGKPTIPRGTPGQPQPCTGSTGMDFFADEPEGAFQVAPGRLEGVCVDGQRGSQNDQWGAVGRTLNGLFEGKSAYSLHRNAYG